MGKEAGILGGLNYRRYKPYKLKYIDLAFIPREKVGLVGLCSNKAKEG